MIRMRAALPHPKDETLVPISPFVTQCRIGVAISPPDRFPGRRSERKGGGFSPGASRFEILPTRALIIF